MPFEVKANFREISKEDFYQRDYKIMSLAFSIHNGFGRFWDEKIYQKELMYRCEDAGFVNVASGVPILVSYKDFQKYYYIDLLIDNAMVYELKTIF